MLAPGEVGDPDVEVEGGRDLQGFHGSGDVPVAGDLACEVDAGRRRGKGEVDIPELGSRGPCGSGAGVCDLASSTSCVPIPTSDRALGWAECSGMTLGVAYESGGVRRGIWGRPKLRSSDRIWC